MGSSQVVQGDLALLEELLTRVEANVMQALDGVQACDAGIATGQLFAE